MNSISKGHFEQATYNDANNICSERGMALASFEQPAESNEVLDFLSSSCRLLHYLKTTLFLHYGYISK